MKGIFATLLTVSLVLCASCAHSSISPLVGGDRDEHGCIGSAGYTTYAEIFSAKGKSVLCRRVKGMDIWKPRKGKESVSIQNGVTRVKIDNYTYTK